jgi:hypothetical protein
MLRVERIPEVLESTLVDGVSGVVLMTVQGSILSSKFLESSDMTAVTLAAITSNIWSNMTTRNPDVSFHLSKMEKGCVGITLAGTGNLVVAYGTNIGMLRGRLEALSTSFTRAFEQMTPGMNT